MLTLEIMQKVRVIAPRSQLKKVTDCLYGFGAIQVQECKIAQTDIPLLEFQSISEMLIKLRSEEKIFNLNYSFDSQEAPIEEIAKKYEALDFGGVDAKRSEILAFESELEKLHEEKRKLLPFRNLRLDLASIQSDRIKITYFELKQDAAKTLEKSLAKIPYEIAYIGDGPAKYALLAYDERLHEKVQNIITKHAVAFFELPMHVSGSYKQEISRIDAAIGEIENKAGLAKSWIEEYGKKNGKAIVKLKEQLQIASLKAELPFKFGRTESFSVVEGWIQQKYMKEFHNDMESIGSPIIEELETKEMPPSKLSNPKAIRPFEFLVEFFSLPKSYELDPTLFISITYPIFFGFIMGDIGYGILTLLIAVAIKLKMKGDVGQKLGGMMALSALSSIFFGLIFAEFFGLEHIFGIEMIPLIHRAKEVEEMINIAILIGVIHLSLGYILGIANQVKNKHYNHAWAKFAWLFLLISMLSAIIGSMEISLMHILKPMAEIYPMPYSLGGIILSMIAIAILESPTHLFEVPSLLANTLSYLRLVALGLSGVIIAQIINQLPVDFDGFFAMATMQKPFDAISLIMFIIFLSIFVIGHIMALVIAIVEGGIQSLRLHYVEFFSKFYEGGGVPFIPIRKRADKP
jgi:V/A-type H+/Na+-transporting ATPase subunit I